MAHTPVLPEANFSRRGFRPTEASTAAVCYVRNTSNRAIRSLATKVRSPSCRRVQDYSLSAATMMAALEQACLLAG